MYDTNETMDQLLAGALYGLVNGSCYGTCIDLQRHLWRESGMGTG